MPELQLVINGKIYRGWEEISVRRSLDTFADTFDLTLTDDQAIFFANVTDDGLVKFHAA